jgi:hypothetical protein
VPYTVIPYQLSGQLVLKNSTTPAHATGAGGAFVTMMLSANAADANVPEANPRTIPAEALNLFILPPAAPPNKPAVQQSSSPSKPILRKAYYNGG